MSNFLSLLRSVLRVTEGRSFHLLVGLGKGRSICRARYRQSQLWRGDKSRVFGRPRKTLNWKAPYEAMQELLQ